MNFKRKAFLYIIMLLALLLPIGVITVSTFEKNMILDEKRIIHEEIELNAQALSSAINKRMALLEGLFVFTQEDTNVSHIEQHFENFAHGLYVLLDGVRNFALAPNGTITYVYPLEGNEAAIGHDLMNDPKLTDDIARTLTTREITLSGPYELVQGGLGLIARKALFIDQEFWGLVTMVVDVLPILAEAGINTNGELVFSIKKKDGSVFYDSRFVGNNNDDFGYGMNLFEEDVEVQEVILSEGIWVLAAMPTNSWEGRVANSLRIVIIIVIFITVLIISIFQFIIGYQEKLRRDINSHVQSLEISNEKYRILFEEAISPIYITNGDEKILDVNNSIVNLLGDTKTNICGKKIGEFFLNTNQLLTIKETADALGISVDNQVEIINHEGEILTCKLTLAKLNLPKKKLLYHGLLIDLTEFNKLEDERNLLQDQILHVQKLESLGILAGGIAHDFNNLLVGILGNASIILSEMEKNTPHYPLVQEISDISKQAGDIAKQMLAYSGKGKFNIQSLDLSTLVVDMKQILSVSNTKSIMLKYDLQRNLPLINVDSTQIRQVIMNLVINASQAIKHNKGQVSIRTRLFDVNRNFIQSQLFTSNLDNKKYISLEISDNGQGIDKGIVQNIFDPFYTTKKEGKGLGLSVVIGIVRAHEGGIAIASKINSGTTFNILFPIPETTINTTDQILKNNYTGKFKGMVLLCDDQEPVRIVARRMLEKLGFDVVEAKDGEEGYNVFRTHKDELVLTIIDLTMPKVSGYELVKKINEQKPEIKIILSSGYNKWETTKTYDFLQLDGYLQKPYSFEDFRSEISKSMK